MPAWVGELLARGVVERKARQLALDIPDDRPVLDQIEYAEYLIQQDRRGRGKISILRWPLNRITRRHGAGRPKRWNNSIVWKTLWQPMGRR
jgi:hypothetical protein